MKEIGYGKGYKYAHNYADAVVDQPRLPEKLAGRAYYQPTDRGFEEEIKRRLSARRAKLERKLKVKDTP